MKNNFLSLFLSLFLHFVLFILIFIRFDDEVYIPPKSGSNEGRISIKDFKVVPKIDSEVINQQTIIGKLDSNISDNKQSNKKVADPKQNNDVKKITQQKQQKKSDNTKSIKSEKTETLTEKQLQQTQKKSISSPSIYSFNNSNMKEINELYGEEIFSLNPNERKFIEDNLKDIGKITQRYLKYPQIAGRMGQSGYNVVEFYLYPNGDISDLKIIRGSGHTMLDKNSLHTVEIAYKDYPYPKVKTKIRIRVMYQLY